jgi:hypothetical protein
MPPQKAVVTVAPTGNTRAKANNHSFWGWETTQDRHTQPRSHIVSHARMNSRLIASAAELKGWRCDERRSMAHPPPPRHNRGPNLADVERARLMQQEGFHPQSTRVNESSCCGGVVRALKPGNEWQHKDARRRGWRTERCMATAQCAGQGMQEDKRRRRW